jgi:hypothetical protein
MENRNFQLAAPGFYLATDPATAHDFGARAGGGEGYTVLTYTFTQEAFESLSAAGARFQPVPGRLQYPGQEYVIPPTAFSSV